MTGPARENYREDVAGRANVEDTPELKAYYDDLERFEAAALWTVANKIEPWEPKSKSLPVLWRYAGSARARAALDRSGGAREGRPPRHLSQQSRRRDVAAAGGWLYSGLQVMKPGEVASAHQHSASALRFIMEGKGAYTIVDGHKMTLGENDFVLTPNGSWHEHGVAAEGTECIWQDGLDIPLVNALEANFYAVHPTSSSRRLSGRRLDRELGRARPAAGRCTTGRSPIRRCSNTSGSRPTRRCSATPRRPTARRSTAC